MTPTSDDRAMLVHLNFDDRAHDGAGWYYYDAEHPDEGCVGSFVTMRGAARHARRNGYFVENHERLRCIWWQGFLSGFDIRQRHPAIQLIFILACAFTAGRLIGAF